MLRLRGCHPVSPGFPSCSATRAICNSLEVLGYLLVCPTTPHTHRPKAVSRMRFRLYPVRSPLLGASLLFSLPPGTEMFHFPGFPEPVLCVQTGLTGHDPSWVSPFGHPWISGSLAPPQGFSQPRTSFFGSCCQGIHRMLLFACRTQLFQMLALAMEFSRIAAASSVVHGLPGRVRVVP